MAVGVTVKGPGRKKLKALIGRLDSVAKVKRDIALAQSEEVLDLIREGFNKEANPYGQKWKKRKRETRKTLGRKVLSGETSRLRTGWHRSALGPGGFTVSSSVKYATAHQSPRRGKRPQRAMVPTRRGFPKKWKRPLSEAAIDAIKTHLDV